MEKLLVANETDKRRSEDQELQSRINEFKRTYSPQAYYEALRDIGIPQNTAEHIGHVFEIWPHKMTMEYLQKNSKK